MAAYRSGSYNDRAIQLELYRRRLAAPPASGLYEYRSHGPSYAYGGYGSKGVKERDATPPSSSPPPSSSSKKGGWTLSHPDLQRRKRVASYKTYGVEGRVKGSLRRSFRWLKNRYNRILSEW